MFGVNFITKPASMADYYSALTRKIQQIHDDPAKLREVVYEAARLALRWQVHEQSSTMSLVETKRHILDLDEAIARLEAEAAARMPADAIAAQPVPPNESSAAAIDAECEDVRAEPARQDRTEPLPIERLPVALVATEALSSEALPSEALPSRLAPSGAAPSEVSPVGLAPPAVGPVDNGHAGDTEAGEPLLVAARDAPAIAGPAPVPGTTSAKSRGVDMAEPRGRRIRDRPIDLDHAVDLGRPVDLDLESGRSFEPGRPIDLDQAVDLGRPVDLDEATAAAPAEPVRPQPAEARRRAGPARGREPVSAPQRPSYLVNPADFVNPEIAQRMAAGAPANGRTGPPFAITALMIALQLVVAGVAVAALLVALSGRTGPAQTATDAAPVATARSGATAPSGYTMAGGSQRAAAPLKSAAAPSTTSTTAPPTMAPPAAAPSIAAPSIAAPSTTATPITAPPPAATPSIGTSSTVAPADATPATLTAGGASFPRPPGYGVYAIDNDRLTALAQVPTTPVDSRISRQMKITVPSRTLLPPGKPAFVVFRRDIASGALDKMPLRIAARVAHGMNFDSAGRAVMTTPATDTWIIRDQGYDLRASPVEGDAELVRLSPDDPSFSLPAGRYELMLGEHAYDFVVPGEVTDPAHCVEGVTTVRGQVYNECKPVL